VRRKAYTKKEREIQVITWFAIRIQKDNEDVASMSQIASGLALSPSSHLRSILDGMVDDGRLEKILLQRPGRWIGWGYRLTSGTYQRPRKRQLVMNFHSNGIKQTEMF
jgi:hypothetical protein